MPRWETKTWGVYLPRGVVSVTTCVTNRCRLPSFMEHWQFYNYQANPLRSLETGVRFRILHIRLKQNVFGTAGNKVMYLIRMCNIIQTKHEGVAIASLFQNNARISSHNEITYHGFIGFNLTNVWTSYTVPLYIKWNVSEWNSNEWLYVFSNYLNTGMHLYSSIIDIGNAGIPS